MNTEILVILIAIACFLAACKIISSSYDKEAAKRFSENLQEIKRNYREAQDSARGAKTVIQEMLGELED